MNKCKQLEGVLKRLNKARIVQDTFDPWCLSSDVSYGLLLGAEFIEDGLLIEKHKGFETGVAVFKFQNGPYTGEILGIKMITDMYSESWDFENCDFPLEFFRMKKETVTTYTQLTPKK